MPKLRLHVYEEEPAPATLPFPQPRPGDDARRPEREDDPAAAIEHTLGHVQSALDEMVQDLGSVLRLPDLDDGDWPPAAA